MKMGRAWIGDAHGRRGDWQTKREPRPGVERHAHDAAHVLAVAAVRQGRVLVCTEQHTLRQLQPATRRPDQDLWAPLEQE